ELFGRPILFGKLVIGQDRNSLFEQFSEQFWTVAFPIKHQCEPMGARIFGQPLFLLGRFWRQLLEPGNNVVLDRGDQSWIDLLVDVQKRLAIHGIDPVIHRRSQTQPFPRHVMTREWRFLSVINAHVPIAVVIHVRAVLTRHPFLANCAFHSLARPGSWHSRSTFSRSVRTSGIRSSSKSVPHSPVAW